MSTDGFYKHLNNYRYMANYFIGNDNQIRVSQSTSYTDIISMV